MEGETLKEWLDREEKEKALVERDNMISLCNMMWRLDCEGHGVIKWVHRSKIFHVCLERLYKERVNREVLLQMLRCCVQVMMQLIPTFRGVVIDVICERKRMLEGTKGRFTQRRMQNTVIRWFLDGLPNNCTIYVQEELRDLGLQTQRPYWPSEILNLHCFGGDELKVEAYKDDNVN
ncbi:hypothetical protein MPTK1_4g23620 [Marchantia polymorpha subsp. ruderalis]|uniref:Uncharacterized protein n=2 Tax=Marchantia polymorpha TaxID=3197 RepID=A0AAF6BD16_MARPO|nr:hypothetical protein MARPO_0020s0125 [Marchantia polymorpha]BBN09900.1 hypothetical protein Mp_4g23620 [Marchantia polymorpha subsp. ruderalis]|eukprot:PTQ44477.1 hypothetical protein MARPO_0020s0125 [Marchantia polymorpha]